MDELMDMIVADESPSQVTDKIKEILFAKSAERIDMIKPVIAADMFNDGEQDSSEEEE
jgi:hypothetical protein|tara:strand:+ start:383 stop:556 length:174 start_codon:yes stop_codon:yes gene_type:complete